jgi:hypothetical protein
MPTANRGPATDNVPINTGFISTLPRFPYRRVSVKIKVLLRLITPKIIRGVSPNLDEKVSR